MIPAMTLKALNLNTNDSKLNLHLEKKNQIEFVSTLYKCPGKKCL